ncbi:MAG: DUF1501 domain-containing protein [Vicinamibacterales bacterium]
MIPRRVFLRDGGCAVIGLSMVPGFLVRTLQAASPTNRLKTLVVIFQRGGADGLNIVVPFGDSAYYDYRPTIGVAAPGKGGGALDLDGQFGLNPALQPLLPLYKKGQFGIINAVGSPDTGGRSHFQAQDFMESAAPGNKTISTGWLNRYLQAVPDPDRKPLRATAIGETLPKALRGPASAMTLGSMSGFGVQGAELYESMYSQDSNALLTGTAREMFEAIRQLKSARPEQYAPAKGVNYGGGNNPGALGNALMQVAQLIKANVGLQVAFVDVSGGWDTHASQNERLPGLLRGFGQALAAFHQDLGDRMDDVVVLTMSEFGRTARENGNGGTDHGHANFMFVSGGAVKGGRILGKWPGLAGEQLNENRDLALTTDFRDVLAELLVGHLGCEKPDAIFPGYGVDRTRFTGIL